MPGRTPPEAVAAFLDPLSIAVLCTTRGKLVLTRGARGDVGETHAWTLNGGRGAVIGDGYRLRASMHFEVLDRGGDAGRATLHGEHSRITGNHICIWTRLPSPKRGVFLSRAPLPTPRISLEWMVRWAIENPPGVQPMCDDWSERLQRTEELFDGHKSW